MLKRYKRGTCDKICSWHMKCARLQLRAQSICSMDLVGRNADQAEIDVGVVWKMPTRSPQPANNCSQKVPAFQIGLDNFNLVLSAGLVVRRTGLNCAALMPDCDAREIACRAHDRERRVPAYTLKHAIDCRRNQRYSFDVGCASVDDERVDTTTKTTITTMTTNISSHLTFRTFHFGCGRCTECWKL